MPSYLSGTIVPVPRNADYSLNPTDTKISSSYLQNYILAQTVNVAEKDLQDLTPDDNVTVEEGTDTGVDISTTEDTVSTANGGN